MPHDTMSVDRSALRGLVPQFESSFGNTKWATLDVSIPNSILRRRRVDRDWLKRIFDVTAAASLLVLLTPVLLIVALLIKLTSRGPVIFSQTRPGRDLKPFSMLKFRTMFSSDDFEKEEARRMKDGRFLKDENDSRITPLGRFLRKCSLDEFPQLVNVLRGEMSLVGPRPILNCEVACFDESVQRYRFSVRPGLTGLWQVSGRSNTTDLRRLMFDIQYVETSSFLLDLKILLKTIPAVLKCQGAK